MIDVSEGLEVLENVRNDFLKPDESGEVNLTRQNLYDIFQRLVMDKAEEGEGVDEGGMVGELKALKGGARDMLFKLVGGDGELLRGALRGLEEEVGGLEFGKSMELLGELPELKQAVDTALGKQTERRVKEMGADRLVNLTEEYGREVAVNEAMESEEMLSLDAFIDLKNQKVDELLVEVGLDKNKGIAESRGDKEAKVRRLREGCESYLDIAKDRFVNGKEVVTRARAKDGRMTEVRVQGIGNLDEDELALGLGHLAKVFKERLDSYESENELRAATEISWGRVFEAAATGHGEQTLHDWIIEKEGGQSEGSARLGLAIRFLAGGTELSAAEYGAIVHKELPKDLLRALDQAWEVSLQLHNHRSILDVVELRLAGHSGVMEEVRLEELKDKYGKNFFELINQVELEKNKHIRQAEESAKARFDAEMASFENKGREVVSKLSINSSEVKLRYENGYINAMEEVIQEGRMERVREKAETVMRHMVQSEMLTQIVRQAGQEIAKSDASYEEREERLNSLLAEMSKLNLNDLYYLSTPSDQEAFLKRFNGDVVLRDATIKALWVRRLIATDGQDNDFVKEIDGIWNLVGEIHKGESDGVKLSKQRGELVRLYNQTAEMVLQADSMLEKKLGKHPYNNWVLMRDIGMSKIGRLSQGGAVGSSSGQFFQAASGASDRLKSWVYDTRGNVQWVNGLSVRMEFGISASLNQLQRNRLQTEIQTVGQIRQDEARKFINEQITPWVEVVRDMTVLSNVEANIKELDRPEELIKEDPYYKSENWANYYESPSGKPELDRNEIVKTLFKWKELKIEAANYAVEIRELDAQIDRLGIFKRSEKQTLTQKRNVLLAEINESLRVVDPSEWGSYDGKTDLVAKLNGHIKARAEEMARQVARATENMVSLEAEAEQFLERHIQVVDGNGVVKIKYLTPEKGQNDYRNSDRSSRLKPETINTDGEKISDRIFLANLAQEWLAYSGKRAREWYGRDTSLTDMIDIASKLGDEVGELKVALENLDEALLGPKVERNHYSTEPPKRLRMAPLREAFATRVRAACENRARVLRTQLVETKAGLPEGFEVIEGLRNQLLAS